MKGCDLPPDRGGNRTELGENRLGFQGNAPLQPKQKALYFPSPHRNKAKNQICEIPTEKHRALPCASPQDSSAAQSPMLKCQIQLFSLPEAAFLQPAKRPARAGICGPRADGVASQFIPDTVPLVPVAGHPVKHRVTPQHAGWGEAEPPLQLTEAENGQFGPLLPAPSLACPGFIRSEQDSLLPPADRAISAALN